MAIYYLATSGNDGNPGTIGAPWLTWGHALPLLVAGDTLYARAGTYPGITFNTIVLPSGSSWSAPVTVSAYPGETVTMPSLGGNCDVTHGQYLIFQNFWIVSGGGEGVSVVNAAGPAPYFAGDSYIRFLNLDISGFNADQNGVYIYANHVEVVNCHIHDPQSLDGQGHGVYTSGDYNLFDGCHIHHCQRMAIHQFSAGYIDVINYHTIRNCHLHDNVWGNLLIAKGTGTAVYNNLIHSTGANNLDVAYGAHDALIYNNTIYDAQAGYGIRIGDYTPTTTGTIVTNNVVYGNAGNLSDSGSGSVFTTNLTIDPLFVNAAAGDFHLLVTSPAINVGTTLGLVTTDYDGVARPQGGAYDIGAFEFVESGPPPDPLDIYYVSPTGNDGNTGAIGSPFLTIAHGLSVLSAGKTLYLRAGSYPDLNTNLLTLPSGTSWGVPVTVAGYPGETVTLAGLGGNFTEAAGQYLIFKDFRISGAATAITVITEIADNRSGISRVRFQNIEVFGHTGFSPAYLLFASNVEVIGGSIHDAATEVGIAGLYIAGNETLVDGVDISGVKGVAVYVYNDFHLTDGSNDTTIRNCVIHHLSDTGGDSHGIVLATGARNVAKNNIIHNLTFGGAGVEVGPNAIDAQVINNTLTGIVGPGVAIGAFGAATGTVVKNNILFSPGPPYTDAGTASDIANNLTTDPLFVNAGTFNFRLSSAASPAVDTGLTLANVPVDIDGLARPQGLAYDIGAYESEFEGSSGSFTPVGAPSITEGTGSQTTVSVIRTGIAVGRLLVVWISWRGVGITATVSDGTTTFTAGRQTTAPSAAHVHGQFFYLLNSVASGSVTYTATFSAAATSACIIVSEVVHTGAVFLNAQGQNFAQGGSLNLHSSQMTIAGGDGIVFGGYATNGTTSASDGECNNIDATVAAYGTVTFAAMWGRSFVAPFVGDVDVTVPSTNWWVVNGIAFATTAEEPLAFEEPPWRLPMPRVPVLPRLPWAMDDALRRLVYDDTVWQRVVPWLVSSPRLVWTPDDGFFSLVFDEVLWRRAVVWPPDALVRPWWYDEVASPTQPPVRDDELWQRPWVWPATIARLLFYLDDLIPGAPPAAVRDNELWQRPWVWPALVARVLWWDTDPLPGPLAPPVRDDYRWLAPQVWMELVRRLFWYDEDSLGVPGVPPAVVVPPAPSLSTALQTQAAALTQGMLDRLPPSLWDHGLETPQAILYQAFATEFARWRNNWAIVRQSTLLQEASGADLDTLLRDYTLKRFNQRPDAVARQAARQILWTPKGTLYALQEVARLLTDAPQLLGRSGVTQPHWWVAVSQPITMDLTYWQLGDALGRVWYLSIKEQTIVLSAMPPAGANVTPWPDGETPVPPGYGAAFADGWEDVKTLYWFQTLTTAAATCYVSVAPGGALRVSMLRPTLDVGTTQPVELRDATGAVWRVVVDARDGSVQVVEGSATPPVTLLDPGIPAEALRLTDALGVSWALWMDAGTVAIGAAAPSLFTDVTPAGGPFRWMHFSTQAGESVYVSVASWGELLSSANPPAGAGFALSRGLGDANGVQWQWGVLPGGGLGMTTAPSLDFGQASTCLIMRDADGRPWFWRINPQTREFVMGATLGPGVIPWQPLGDTSWISCVHPEGGTAYVSSTPHGEFVVRPTPGDHQPWGMATVLTRTIDSAGEAWEIGVARGGSLYWKHLPAPAIVLLDPTLHVRDCHDALRHVGSAGSLTTLWAR